MNNTNIEMLLVSGLNYVHQYFLNYCDRLFKEQRRIDLQIKLRKICNSFRGAPSITKYVLIELKKSLEHIHYMNTETYSKCLKDLEEVIKLYNKYYEDNGIRKN